MSGPPPKAPGTRLGKRGKAGTYASDSKFDTLPRGSGSGCAPPRPPARLHPLARGWYNSLALSGQAAAYEPSDWATALVAAEILDRCLADERAKAALFAEFSAISVRLLCTVGDRRRMRVELTGQGAADPDEAASVTNIAAWQRKLNPGTGAS